MLVEVAEVVLVDGDGVLVADRRQFAGLVVGLWGKDARFGRGVGGSLPGVGEVDRGGPVGSALVEAVEAGARQRWACCRAVEADGAACVRVLFEAQQVRLSRADERGEFFRWGASYSPPRDSASCSSSWADRASSVSRVMDKRRSSSSAAMSRSRSSAVLSAAAASAKAAFQQRRHIRLHADTDAPTRSASRHVVRKLHTVSGEVLAVTTTTKINTCVGDPPPKLGRSSGCRAGKILNPVATSMRRTGQGATR